MLFQDQSLDIIKKTISEARDEILQEDDKIREMLKDFYENRQAKKEYLERYGFDIDKYPMSFYNITKKVIDKRSLVYKTPPDRMLMNAKGDEIEDNPYREFIANNWWFNPSMKVTERYKNLLHHVIFRPVYFSESKRWYPFIETEFTPHFLEDNPLYPFAYSIPKKQDIINTNVKNIRIDMFAFWSPEHHFLYDSTGRFYSVNDGDVNPYGINPFVEMRNELPVDQYKSHGAIDLVECNKTININMMNLNYMLHFQAFNYPYMAGVRPEDVARVKLGPDKLTLIGESGVSVGALDLSPEIMGTIESIKFQMQLIYDTYDLKVNWTIEGNPQSGFSLIVQNMDLYDSLEDDKDIAQYYEKELYKVIQRIDEVEGTGAKLPKDAQVYADFQPIDMPTQYQEEEARKEFELRHNIISEIDLIQEANPDMDEERAEEKWLRNKKINGRLTAGDIFREEFNQPVEE